MLTITATKTVRPNVNDIIVRSPNVQAAHAKKFNRNIPVKFTLKQTNKKSKSF